MDNKDDNPLIWCLYWKEWLGEDYVSFWFQFLNFLGYALYPHSLVTFYISVQSSTVQKTMTQKGTRQSFNSLYQNYDSINGIDFHLQISHFNYDTCDTSFRHVYLFSINSQKYMAFRLEYDSLLIKKC